MLLYKDLPSEVRSHFKSVKGVALPKECFLTEESANEQMLAGLSFDIARRGLHAYECRVGGRTHWHIGARDSRVPRGNQVEA